MPKAKETKEGKASFSVLEIVLIIAIVILLIYTVVLHFQLMQVKDSLGVTNELIGGDSQGRLLSIQEDLQIIKVNINSCSTDFSCESLFKIKNYQCPAGFTVSCENKICVCR